MEESNNTEKVQEWNPQGQRGRGGPRQHGWLDVVRVVACNRVRWRGFVFLKGLTENKSSK